MRRLSKYLVLILWMLASLLATGQTNEDDLQNILQKLDDGESVEHMHINLSDINFATGTANLEPSAKSYLNKVAKLLKLATNINLLIKGHADNTGSNEVNNKLSKERAEAVKRYLIVQNIPLERLEAKGYGSSVPIAENETAEGRAKNRRVEMEILKNKSVKTVQDIIVMRNGDSIGGTVGTYDKEQISYRQFSDGSMQQVSTKGVEKIIFADGREVRFNEPSQAEKEPTESRFRFRPFAESAAFHKGQFVVGMGLGVDNNIGIKYKDNKISLPPVWAVMELPLKHNIGVGVSGGMMQWSPKSSEGAQYTYWCISPRMAYHLNFAEQVDLYAGVAVTGRFATMEAGDGENSISLKNNQFDASAFVGLRYYFNKILGVYGEYGDDNIACARLGLAFRFGR
ncbi:MAG: OmpA family protein [Saprospiraceae bacterium]|nr:OmpA family protein [Saprospiraceae bacterium]